ncbi:hypothetical protein HWN40_00170 [Methanolobus zinderi]|uniref:Uncharacterized protein n=1 Tax=Methanolobus zinderi TaxID=536044 RepID=A0A7D5I3G0_9EURY|nr:hypothetical protein [Methanolobus zinderi]QLC48803.1 hypothetical protein HWN40_00170 [Methanolobus zinderi]
MNKKNGTLIICIAVMLCICLIPTSTASNAEENIVVKDAAQLKMESLEAELGEKGLVEVENYLTLQASLPEVVKNMPFRGLAFAATKPESQIIKMKYIDNFDVSDKEKEEYKAGLQDIWDRYPDKITKDDYEFMAEIGPMIEKEAFSDYQDVGIKWTSTPHEDFAGYACDAYASYARDTAADPDEPGFELPGYRYYNHYEDAEYGVGGAAGRCDAFAGTAAVYADNSNYVAAHQEFGIASHYISDAGIPFHSSGALDQALNFVENLFNSNAHDAYENYIYYQWAPDTDYEFGDYVSGNTQSITVTDPEEATEDNADFSAQYFDYIWDEVTNDPQNFDSDIYVGYYTAQCVRETAKYNHGLYDYIM